MKQIHHKIGALLIGAGLALAATPAVSAVLNSKHDLSAGSTGTIAFTATSPAADTDQTCVFCHTPHAANTTKQIIPLWNRTTTSSTFTLYSDTGGGTLTGKVASADGAGGAAGIGGVSLACLSCHDGTLALASVINAPGSGGTWVGTWTEATGLSASAQTATLAAANVARLDADMSNDHPVAIQYAGGGYTITGAGPYTLNGTSATVNDTAFKGLALSGSQAWVDVDSSSSKTTGDLPLFTNVLPGATTKEPFVECASCHDPHNGTANGMFLRAAAADSAICTACHVK